MSQQHVSRPMRSISNRIAMSLASLSGISHGRRLCRGCAASPGYYYWLESLFGTPRFLFSPLRVSPSDSLAVPSSLWNSDLLLSLSGRFYIFRSIATPGEMENRKRSDVCVVDVVRVIQATRV
jgi:hypothetical protein